MFLIENYFCNSKQELEKREGELIREMGTLNSILVGRTPQEYRDIHKNEKKEYDNIFYEKNKNKILEYKKHYYEKNKDEINRKKKEKRALKKTQQNGL